MNTPYQQGSLDSLCGIYAVVNAVALMAGHLGRLSGPNRHALFDALVDALAQQELLAVAMRHGLDTSQVSMLLRTAKRHLRERHQLQLEIRKPLHRRRQVDKDEVVARLSDHLTVPARTVLVGTKERFSHWSVVRAVSQTSLKLHDSTGRTWLPLASAVFASDWPDGAVRAVPPSSMFFLSLAHLSR